MIDLQEIEVEIAKINNYQGMHLVMLCALQDLCQSRKDVPKLLKRVPVLEKGLGWRMTAITSASPKAVVLADRRYILMFVTKNRQKNTSLCPNRRAVASWKSTVRQMLSLCNDSCDLISPFIIQEWRGMHYFVVSCLS